MNVFEKCLEILKKVDEFVSVEVEVDESFVDEDTRERVHLTRTVRKVRPDISEDELLEVGALRKEFSQMVGALSEEELVELKNENPFDEEISSLLEDALCERGNCEALFDRWTALFDPQMPPTEMDNEAAIAVLKSIAGRGYAPAAEFLKEKGIRKPLK